MARIYRFLGNPIATQERVLRKLLTTARATEWGRRFDFDGIARASDVMSAYRSAVPLHAYDDLAADVVRVRRGEQDVMWPGKVTDFAVSSGTASSGKIIPVSRQTLVANRRFSTGALYHYIAQTGRTSSLGGRFLTLPGRIEEDPEYPGTRVGEVSGLQARYAPRLVTRFLQAVPAETLNMPNWDSKLEAIAERTERMDIRAAVMVPTWALVLFEQVMNRYAARTGRRPSSLRDVWPNFRLFFSGGVALSSYRGLLEEQVGAGSVDFIESYGASEGFFAFQLDPSDSDMALHLDNGVYYEFVRPGDPEQRRYSLGEVEPGVRYQMFVTTASGLWAYGVGDVIRFTSVDPYRVVVAGRVTEMIDRFGEAVFGEEAREALARACEGTGARMRDYHIAPSIPDRHTLPTHQWLVEFETPPADYEAFVLQLDGYLQRVNRHYQIRREAGAFALPEVVSLPKGTFYRWLRWSRARLGAQSKVPRMSEDREIASRLVQLAGEVTEVG